MSTNTLSHPMGSLGRFLREHRERLAPEPTEGRRRRTPGLRREEVAARAGVSVTWYTWLEQGRGGPPSDQVLERLARALGLSAVEREALFLLARQRPPPVSGAPPAAAPPAVQKVLDAMPATPAYVKTRTWDIVAWNRAAIAFLGDFAAVPPGERNGLKRLFADPATRAATTDWEANARFAIAAFRLDLARSGSRPEALALVAELEQTSDDFRRLWAEREIRTHGFGRKRFQHPVVGALSVDTSAFSVDGAEGLTMVVFAPASPADARAMEALLSQTASPIPAAAE
ncbi:MAG TPA: helix-turn-helix transcriptional regulator [Caulobacteraceae bacterium]|nr:helix-turn-helix transcriptional regulator [Caulobacteraceae bacterium]